MMRVLSVLSSFAIILLSERASYFNVIVFLCWFAVCDCGISWSYALTFQSHEATKLQLL